MAVSKLSPEERLLRKREKARIRQQRCRDRKRQAAMRQRKQKGLEILQQEHCNNHHLTHKKLFEVPRNKLLTNPRSPPSVTKIGGMQQLSPDLLTQQEEETKRRIEFLPSGGGNASDPTSFLIPNKAPNSPSMMISSCSSSSSWSFETNSTEATSYSPSHCSCKEDPLPRGGGKSQTTTQPRISPVSPCCQKFCQFEKKTSISLSGTKSLFHTGASRIASSPHYSYLSSYEDDDYFHKNKNSKKDHSSYALTKFQRIQATEELLKSQGTNNTQELQKVQHPYNIMSTRRIATSLEQQRNSPTISKMHARRSHLELDAIDALLRLRFGFSRSVSSYTSSCSRGGEALLPRMDYYCNKQEESVTKVYSLAPYSQSY